MANSTIAQPEPTLGGTSSLQDFLAVTDSVLDGFSAALVSDDISDAMRQGVGALTSLRRSVPCEWWDEFAARHWCRHPFQQIIHQDPFTRHAFDKPRGYPGDADLLDYVYGYRQPPPETTALGRRIYGYTTVESSSGSVKNRMRLLSAKFDALAATVENPQILSIACGHLREAQESDAVRQGRVGGIIALDADKASVALVAQEQARYGVQAMHGSVRTVIAGKHNFPLCDFVYAAGLYDYLSYPVAARLTAKMFDMLRPGGSLLVANFAPDTYDIGYMETCMGWHLIYRDEQQMRRLLNELPAEEIASVRTYREANNNIVILEVARK